MKGLEIRTNMQESREINKLKPHPADTNICTRIFFCWLIPYMRQGLKKEISEDDMFDISESQKSANLGRKLEQTWENELKKKNPSLLRALFMVFRIELFLYGVFFAAVEFVKIGQPMLISKLVSFFGQTESKIDYMKVYTYAAIILLSSLAQVIGNHNYQMGVMNLGMKIRTAACTLIYRKALKLSKTAMAETTVGQMVNLLSNDVGRFDFAVQNLHNIWMAPFETIIITYLVYSYVGFTGLIGAVFLLSFIPFQIHMAKMTSICRLRTAIRTDERVRIMNEIISGIQVIKMYTWEKPFARIVEMAREREIVQIRITSIIRAIMISCGMMMSRAAICLCILTYVLTGNTLTATYAYTITSFYGHLRVAVTIFFPQGITQFAESRVTVNRIQQFLMYDEIKNNAASEINSKIVVREVGISLKNASFKWLNSSADNTLENINFEASSGQLIVLVGPVGGGKTTLLHSILEEILPVSGTVEVRGTISYASQEAWLFGASVRQNILFGQKFDQKKYEEVVKVCALERDFALFPHGDGTHVGERGISLSGGQRARISLARAVYKEADIYLLDDPLSAVDTHVGEKLFKDCICRYLEPKCVVLVTHQLQYLRNCQHVYLLEDGEIKVSGSYQQMKKSESHFAKLLKEAMKEEKKTNEERRLSRVEQVIEMLQGSSAVVSEREKRASGVVTWSVYKSYLKSGGGWLKIIAVFSMFVLTEVFGSFIDYFVTIWVNLEQRRTLQPSSDIRNSSSLTSWWDEKLTDEINLYIYCSLVITFVIIAFTRSISFFKYCVFASTRLHNNMFSKIVNSSMKFFSTNPSGRILNRFAKDVGAVDETLPITLIDTLGIGLTVLAISIVIGIMNPWILTVTGIMLTIFYFMRKAFLVSSRNIKRVEAVTRSPIYTHLTASLRGLTTIRCFGAQRAWIREFDDYQDAYSSAYYMFLTANRGFGFWLDIQCVMYIGCVLISILFIQNESFGGNVGLSLTQAMTLSGMFQWGIRQWTELENQMTSVERIQEYADITPEFDGNTKAPPESWPEEGEIKFENMSLRYSEDLPYVLKELSFVIKPREKIGIVGRTGAGKSSLIQALFRLTEVEGHIWIDGLETKTVGLNALRSKISIIPQEPVLFSGSLRKNLDPFDEYQDEILWNALEEVELKSTASEWQAGLGTEMAEGGSNFSVGQRQLICLARAIVRSNNIMVMDEATANVDPHTDAIIQKTIRKKFACCTVLTIAHRLHTIMDSDKVLVMDAGRAVEFGHPFTLLQNKQGLFYGLVKQTGSVMAQSLQAIAEESFKQSSRN